MFQTKCAECGRELRLKSEAAGKKVRCHCGHVFRVPGEQDEKSSQQNKPASSSSRGAGLSVSLRARPDQVDSPSKNESVSRGREKARTVDTLSVRKGTSHRSLTRQQILNAIPAQLEQKKMSPGYVSALMVVAFLMLILPLLYVALIAGVCYLVYWHYAETTWLNSAMTAARGKSIVFLLLAWASPAIVGVILVVFMIKPLLNRRHYADSDLVLDREKFPLLFDFVDRLCDLLGAPRAHQICVDNSVNASAGFFSRGSFFSNKLTLRIGLPLVAGMSLSQLTMILAHEFGHFRQFWAMRCCFVIEAVNDWFDRVSTERDQWDIWLDKSASEIDSRISWVLHLARLMVWIVRKILTGFRYAGLFVSRSLSRQMEFDADLCSVAIVGSDEFSNAFRRMAELSLGCEIARRSAEQYRREGRPLDNFPHFVAFQADEFPPAVRAFIDAMEGSPVEWTSTHPSNADRKNRAQSPHRPTNFELDCAAGVLFEDFRKLCRELTRRSYCRHDGTEVRADELTSVSELISDQKRRREQFQRAQRIVLQVPSLNVLWFSCEVAWDDSYSDSELLRQIREARQSQLTLRKEAVVACGQLQDLETKFEIAVFARLKAASGKKLKKGEYPVPLRSFDDVNAWLTELNAQYQTAVADLLPFQNSTARRIHLALLLAIRQGGDSVMIQKYWNTLQVLGRIVVPISEFERKLRLVAWALEHRTQLSQQLFDTLISRFQERLREECEQLYLVASATEYPFELPYQVDHTGEALLPCFQDSGNIVLLHADCDRFASGFQSLWRRLQGSLCEIAEDAEVRAGFSLTEPADS